MDLLKQSAGQAPASVTGTQQPAAGLSSPALPLRNGAMPLAELIDLYMGQYAGRDPALVHRLTWWKARRGQTALEELTDDHVHSDLEALAHQSSRFYAGKDADGRPIYKSKRRPMAPATLNRYLAALGSVISWAIKRRIAPRGLIHPCRMVERRAENNEMTRFLSPEERRRLLEACRSIDEASDWSSMFLLVVLALTTGARKGELMRLCWRDVDLDAAIAYCGTTKNGDPKILPLTPAVVEEARKHVGKGDHRVFGSPRDRRKPFAFEKHWNRVLTLAKIRDFRFHDLRHSCASMLAQSGATLLEIADVLGHRQLSMTKRYSHLTVGHKAGLVNRVMGDLR